MVFLATVDPSPRPQPMKFPVFSLYNRELVAETSSLVTASSSGESANHRFRDRLPFSGPRGFADANIAAWRPEPRQP